MDFVLILNYSYFFNIVNEVGEKIRKIKLGLGCILKRLFTLLRSVLYFFCVFEVIFINLGIYLVVYIFFFLYLGLNERMRKKFFLYIFLI